MLQTQKKKKKATNSILFTLQAEAALLFGLGRGLVCPLATALCSLDSELCTKIGVHCVTKTRKRIIP